MPTSNPATWKTRRQQERLADVSASRPKSLRPPITFCASGIDGTFLVPRVRARPGWRYQPPPDLPLAHNRLPLSKQRRR